MSENVNTLEEKTWQAMFKCYILTAYGDLRCGLVSVAGYL